MHDFVNSQACNRHSSKLKLKSHNLFESNSSQVRAVSSTIGTKRMIVSRTDQAKGTPVIKRMLDCAFE